MTHEEIIEDVRRVISEDERFRKEFFLNGYSGSDLGMYHHGLGTWIRNRYKLWSIPWEPEIRDGVDYSPFHPDSVSMTIIQEVWKRGPL